MVNSPLTDGSLASGPETPIFDSMGADIDTFDENDPIIIHEGDVYFDKSTRYFTQQREKDMSSDSAWGDMCEYFASAKTVRDTICLSKEYVDQNLVRVDYIDQFAERDEFGWKAKPFQSVVNKKSLREKLKKDGKR